MIRRGLSLSYHPLYRIWRGIKERCYDKNHRHYHRYGGRGIFMCRLWKYDFKTFYDWCVSHGWKPGLQINRKNNNRGYAPWNCNFVTSKINCNNKSNNRYLIIFNEKKTVAQWSEDYRCVVDPETFKVRIGRGWNPEKALTTPTRGNRYVMIFNEMKTIAECCRDDRCVVDPDTFKVRIRRGWNPEKALITPAGKYTKK